MTDLNLCEECGQVKPKQSKTEHGHNWKMELGDCTQLMQLINHKSMDGVITDVPYGSGGDSMKARMEKSKSKYITQGCSYQSTLADIDGDSLHPESWTKLMDETFAQIARVLTDDGVFAAFIDWRNYAYLMQIINRKGLRIRGTVIWDKVGGRPYKGGFRLQSEFILWGSKGKMPRNDLYLKGVLPYSTKTTGKVHITEKPLKLMEEIVQICKPQGTILDPFAGSSTTGIAALNKGYQYHGMESVPAYFDVSCQRLCANNH